MRAKKLLISLGIIGTLAGGTVPAAFIAAGSGAAPAAVYMHSAKPDVYMHS